MMIMMVMMTMTMMTMMMTMLELSGRDQVGAANLSTNQVEVLQLGGRIMLRIGQEDSHHLVISGVTKHLAEEYSQAVQDSLLAARILVSDLVSSQEELSTTVNIQTRTFSGREEPVIKLLHSSLFSVPSLSYECQTSFRSIARTVLHTVSQLVRIETICFTSRNIRTVKGARRSKIRGRYDDSSSDSDEETEDC